MDQTSVRPVVLVTGGGTGIGAAVARLLAQTYLVVICGRRPQPIESVAAETGGHAIAGDCGDPDDVARIIQQATTVAGRLDALVLNAGIVEAAKIGDLTSHQWEATIRTNLTGPFLMARAALPHLIKSHGTIVSVSSVAASRLSPGLGAYSASKAGLTLLTQNIALEYAQYGVRANIVAPGWVRTEMADAEMAATNEDIESAYAKVTRFVPQKRPAQAVEIAEAIAWLLSPASSYVNGAVLRIDGGLSVVDPGAAAFG